MYSIVDIESTGGNYKRERITEIAIYRYDGQKIVDSFVSLINPGLHIPSFISGLTGITNEMVEKAPRFGEVAERILEITEGTVFVAHNVQFDYGFIRQEFKSLGYSFHRKKICSVQLSKILLPNQPSYSLGNLCKNLNIKIKGRHRAGGDAKATVKLFGILLEKDNGMISEMLDDSKIKYLPDSLDYKTIQKIPEETGVYFFHNDYGDVIFAGKSMDIKSQVVHHFTLKPASKRKLKILEEVTRISYETTGSELIAQIKESYEVSKHKPKYNRSPRSTSFKYGIFKERDKKGYHQLQVRKVKRGERPEVYYESHVDAELSLFRRIQEFNLCPKLCGKDKSKGACANYQIDRCNGACIQEEKKQLYNTRVEDSLAYFRYPFTNFFIVGEGRTIGESSVICIENEKFIGYGYFKQDTNKEVSKLRQEIVEMRGKHAEINKLIRSYLKKNKLDRVIEY